MVEFSGSNPWTSPLYVFFCAVAIVYATTIYYMVSLLYVLWSKLWRMIMFDAKDLDKIWYG